MCTKKRLEVMSLSTEITELTGLTEVFIYAFYLIHTRAESLDRTRCRLQLHRGERPEIDPGHPHAGTLTFFPHQMRHRRIFAS